MMTIGNTYLIFLWFWIESKHQNLIQDQEFSLGSNTPLKMPKFHIGVPGLDSRVQAPVSRDSERSGELGVSSVRSLHSPFHSRHARDTCRTPDGRMPCFPKGRQEWTAVRTCKETLMHQQATHPGLSTAQVPR